VIELLKHDYVVMPVQTVRWLELVFGEGLSAEEASRKVAEEDEKQMRSVPVQPIWTEGPNAFQVLLTAQEEESQAMPLATSTDEANSAEAETEPAIEDEAQATNLAMSTDEANSAETETESAIEEDGTRGDH
jgi:hypothetical protein